MLTAKQLPSPSEVAEGEVVKFPGGCPGCGSKRQRQRVYRNASGRWVMRCEKCGSRGHLTPGTLARLHLLSGGKA